MFVVVTVLCLLFGSLGYAVNWMRQRHALLDSEVFLVPSKSHPTAPGGLWIIGETGYEGFLVDDPDDAKRAKLTERLRALFPESEVIGREKVSGTVVLFLGLNP